MTTRKGKSHIDPTWAHLLARLRILAFEYGEHVGPELATARHASPYAAMHTSLVLLATLAELFQNGRRGGWSALMTFVPPHADVGRAARVSVSIVEGIEPSRSDRSPPEDDNG